MNKIWEKSEMQSKFKNRFVTFISIIGIFLLVNNVHAAVWLLDPTVTLSYEYSENYRLDTVSALEDDVGTTTLSGEVAVKGKSERLDFLGLLRIDAPSYSGDDDDLSERNNQTVGLNTGYWLSDKNRVSLRSSYIRDTQIRDSQIEVDPEDFGDTGSLDPTLDVDQNLIRENVRRSRARVQPRWDFQFSEKTNFGIDYLYKDHSFSGSGSALLVEFESHAIAADIARKVTERDKVTFRISEERFEPDSFGPDQDIDTTEARIGWVHDFSETFRMDVTAGGYDSDFDNAIKSSDSGFVGNIGATKRAGLTSYRVNLEKRVAPTSSGRQVEVDELSLKVSHAFTEKLSFNFNGRYFDSETTDGSDGSSNRDYFSLKPGLSWRFLPSWVASASYSYEEEDPDDEPGDADSSTAFISISWSPPRQF